ncbi:hypothetical protein ACIXMS_09620 [Bacteroides fragilis]
MAVGSQGMGRFLVFIGQDRVAVSLHIGRELVEGKGVKLIVRHAGRFRLEFIQPDRDVAFRQILHGDRIRGVVDQYVRIASHIDQMDRLIVYLGRIVGDSIQEVGCQPRIEPFHQLAGPHFRIDSLESRTRRHESAQSHRDDSARNRSISGVNPRTVARTTPIRTLNSVPKINFFIVFSLFLIDY